MRIGIERWPDWADSTVRWWCRCRCARCGQCARCDRCGWTSLCQMPSDHAFGIGVLARFLLKLLVHFVETLRGKMLVQPILDAKPCLGTPLFHLRHGNLICMDWMWIFTFLSLGTTSCVWIEEAGIKIKVSRSFPWRPGMMHSCLSSLHGWRWSWLNHWILKSHSLYLLVSRLPWPWLARFFVGVPGGIPKTLIHM